MKAAAWIDRLKVAKGWESDYRVAQEIGVTRSTVSKYRSRDSTLDDETAKKVAGALGVELGIVLADQAMERTKDEEARGAWSSILQRLGGVAAGVLVAVGVSTSPAPAYGKVDITKSASIRAAEYTSYEVTICPWAVAPGQMPQ